MTQAAENSKDLPVDPDLGGGTDLKVLGAIGTGGALGGLARYAVPLLMPAGPGGFPWATIGINVSGSFALGVLLVVLLERLSASRYLRPFMATGVLSGYTTFSALALESDVLIGNGRMVAAAFYAVASLAGGVAAAWAGITLGRRTAGSAGR